METRATRAATPEERVFTVQPVGAIRPSRAEAIVGLIVLLWVLAFKCLPDNWTDHFMSADTHHRVANILFFIMFPIYCAIEFRQFRREAKWHMGRELRFATEGAWERTSVAADDEWSEPSLLFSWEAVKSVAYKEKSPALVFQLRNGKKHYFQHFDDPDTMAAVARRWMDARPANEPSQEKPFRVLRNAFLIVYSVATAVAWAILFYLELDALPEIWTPALVYLFCALLCVGGMFALVGSPLLLLRFLAEFPVLTRLLGLLEFFTGWLFFGLQMGHLPAKPPPFYHF